MYALSFALIIALSPMAIDLYLPAVPAITRSLASDIQIIELSISTYMLGAAAGQLLAAPASDRLGRKPVMLAGIALFLVATAGCMAAGSAEQLLLFRMIQGVGAGAGAVNVMAAVGDLYDEHEAARVFATIHIIVLTAPLIAPVVGAILITWFPWQVNFGFMAVYAVVAGAIAMSVLPETAPPGAEPGRSRSVARDILDDFRRVLSRQCAGLFNLTIATAYACFFVFLTDAAFVYLDYFAAPTLMFPVLFGANVLLMMIGNRINVALLGRFRPRQLIPLGHAIQVVSASALLVYCWLPSQSLLAFVPLVMLATSANTFIIGNSTARYISLFDARRGTASAVAGVMQYLVGGLLVIGITLVHDGTPKTMAAGMLGCAIVSALGTAAIARHERHVAGSA